MRSTYSEAIIQAKSKAQAERRSLFDRLKTTFGGRKSSRSEITQPNIKANSFFLFFFFLIPNISIRLDLTIFVRQNRIRCLWYSLSIRTTTSWCCFYSIQHMKEWRTGPTTELALSVPPVSVHFMSSWTWIKRLHTVYEGCLKKPVYFACVNDVFREWIYKQTVTLWRF